jgi:hypothetical protein|mmetsp:Transcript_37924/g.112626  ORF Transcript_37924/g.112626 Transcript_37924/m.112626 type:complete len:445 (-) Transcript_37924:90-1424(-)
MERSRRRSAGRPLCLAAVLALAAHLPVAAAQDYALVGGEDIAAHEPLAAAQADGASHRVGFMRPRARTRARSRSAERSLLLTQGEAVQPMLTTPQPTFGLANVTKPTMVPPNMLLDPWADAQPADTALGNFLTGSLSGAPTATPPPLQAALALMAGSCPILDQWPKVIEIEAPGPCQAESSGRWSAPPTGSASAGVEMISWSQSCSLFAGGLAPTISYSAPGGAAFAMSSTAITLVGNKIEIYDCGGVLKYYLEERVYHESNMVDQDSCMKYNSCDGTVWLQYFLRDASNKLVAHTGYLKLFEESYEILDATGLSLGMASRKGDWNPISKNCGGDRKWEFNFADAMPPGPFADITQQWPLAVMVTVAAVRDASRRPSGLVAPSWCEITKTGLALCCFILCSALFACGTVVFVRVGRGPLRDFFHDLEERVCPRRMRKQSKYEGH